MHYPTGRSSAITLPSFGRLPGATSFTSPPSFVTARSVATTPPVQGRGGRRPSAHNFQPTRPARPRDQEPQPAELGMALADVRHLGGTHEHALDLGGLVGTAHPARQPHIGAPATRAARHHRREVAGREPDHRIVRVEPTAPAPP